MLAEKLYCTCSWGWHVWKWGAACCLTHTCLARTWWCRESCRWACSGQVWSISQFYSVDKVKDQCAKVHFQQTHNQGFRQPILMVSLFLCSSDSNAWGELIALEGPHVSLKSPSRVWDGDNVGVAGRYRREKDFPDKGSLICHPGKSMIFLHKGNRKKLS